MKKLAIVIATLILISISASVVDGAKTYHPPIFLDSNQSLQDFVEENGFSGRGTTEDPYVIKGLIIWSNGLSPCISIENTDLYVMISSCEFHSNISESIEISNSKNIILENNSFYGWGGTSIYDGKNMKIKENTFETESQAIEISSSRTILLENNTITRTENITYEAIQLFLSDDILVFGNDIVGNSGNQNPIGSTHMIGNGIEVEDSTNCRVLRNSISHTDTAISFINSETLTIEQNHIIWNYIGIYVNSSSGLFFHNDMMNNTVQASQRDSDFRWDAGYPDGGNYWSDYGGKDEKKGPEQSIPGSDGIGDERYEISRGSYDRYPLMSGFEDFNSPGYAVSGNYTTFIALLTLLVLIFSAVIWYWKKRKPMKEEIEEKEVKPNHENE